MNSKKNEDNRSKAGAGYRRGKSKQRHKFTKEELKKLKRVFDCTPYPDFTTKDELALQFQCDVRVIDNWFQNRRARSSQGLKDKIFDIRRMRKCQDHMLSGPQDTQVQASNCNPGQISYTQVAPNLLRPGDLAFYFVQTKKASGERYDSRDSVVQSVGMRSIGTVEYQGATGSESSFNFRPMGSIGTVEYQGATGSESSFNFRPMGSIGTVEYQGATGSESSFNFRPMGSIGTVEYQGATGSVSSFNFRPTNFTLPPVSEQYYMGGDQLETWESQYSTFPLADYVSCVQGQRQMDCNGTPVFPGQQQNNWEYQLQQLQHPQNCQERVSLADWFVEQQVSSFFPPEHQDQFDPSDGDSAGFQMLLCKQQTGFHQMPFWLPRQQVTADSCTPPMTF